MAVTYGFFNSVNGDRKYNAEQMSEYFRGIINEGVYQHVDGGLAVTAGTGLAVNVAAGRAIIQNRWVQNSAAMSLTIAAASETYARKDAVVIRLNWSSRSISIAVKTGTPAASPVAPSMTRNSTTYEMALAYVNVAANATSVTVTDKRSDSTVCGWVTVAQSTSGEVDAQLNAMKTGFDEVTYSSPAAMVQGCDELLQGQIDAIEEKTWQMPIIWNNLTYNSLKPVETSSMYDNNGNLITNVTNLIFFEISVTGGTSFNAFFEGAASRNHYFNEFDANDQLLSYPLKQSDRFSVALNANTTKVKISVWTDTAGFAFFCSDVARNYIPLFIDRGETNSSIDLNEKIGIYSKSKSNTSVESYSHYPNALKGLSANLTTFVSGNQAFQTISGGDGVLGYRSISTDDFHIIDRNILETTPAATKKSVRFCMW